jgi:hypothetical protein
MKKRHKYRIMLKRGQNGARSWECVTETGKVLRNRLQAAVVDAVVKRARARLRKGLLSQVILHGVKGRIKWERTYGADPKRRKG